MGKAYSEEQRLRVKGLLESGRDEESIEKETGVSDRTIRRWKLELERTGRIGKPPESRTGRHRVLNAEVEAALFEHVKDKPDMSVDDMLWWLYDAYKIVVGTRTIRRVFERKGDKVMTKGRTGAQHIGGADEDDEEEEDDSPIQHSNQYQSPYAPMQATAQSAEQQLAQALQQQTPQTPYPVLGNANMAGELPDDEETIQLELEQIALQKREVELKLKMRRLQQGKGTPSSRQTVTPQSATSTLFNPQSTGTPQGPKRDSRSKKKIEESKKRTAERQERMLRELERRSRRRDHLTAEWVQSKDIWPLRAQGMLADLMHQYACYAYSQNNEQTFEAMYRDLYQLVDLSKGDWVPQMHDELLRERMKRKMGQLRTKMQKTGEIVGRGDAYGGWSKAENYTGEAAGEAIGDESELQSDMQQAQSGAVAPLHHQMLEEHQHQSQPNHSDHPSHQQIQYEPVPDHHQQVMHQHSGMPYGAAQQLMQQQHQSHPGPPQQSQYPMMPQSHHPGMMPYGSMDGGHQPQGMSHQEGGMVM
ncbi:hypothetical protein LTR36_003180 [Oleoguttula mirabilis]|uniref:Uncharacterized protein n=1 Tax=Oleoguttula mirabilis TaxID=1507867 RepID=A0AAV9JX60_9PEZI|nr:hypothetical protein LTR36_003180 [Oleoguttula mirabilis]